MVVMSFSMAYSSSTPNEVIGHLTDSEWVYGYRLRLILCEDDPASLAPTRISGWLPYGTMSASLQNSSKSFGRFGSLYSHAVEQPGS